jgi:hypothetical protein
MPRLLDDVKQCGELVAVVGFCQGFQTLFHNQMCGLMFRCDCVWGWQGGWVDCNVHNKSGPRCPWCIARASISWTTDSLVLALMVLAYEAAPKIAPLRPDTSPLAMLLWRLLASVAVFFGAGLLVAAAFFWGSPAYPWFLTGPMHGMVNSSMPAG